MYQKATEVPYPAEILPTTIPDRQFVIISSSSLLIPCIALDNKEKYLLNTIFYLYLLAKIKLLVNYTASHVLTYPQIYTSCIATNT